MKRTKKDYHIERFFDLFFWRECRVCLQEFRREWGFRAKQETFSMVAQYEQKWVYGAVCCECAPTIEEAEKALRLMVMRPKRPKPPPPPPPKDE